VINSNSVTAPPPLRDHPLRWANEMKIKEEDDSLSVCAGPSPIAGGFFVLFGLPFLLGGVAIILAYFGLFPAEEKLGWEALALGAVFGLSGSFFTFCGYCSIFAYERYVFSKKSKQFRIFEGRSKLKKQCAFEQVSHLEVIVTQDEYRTGKLGKLSLFLSSGEELILVEEESFPEITKALSRISDFTGLKTQPVDSINSVTPLRGSTS